MNPLDQLKDIQVPDEISVFPLALGYWLVIICFLIIFIMLAWWLYKNRDKRKLSKFRKATISAITELDDSDQHFHIKIQHIIKNASTKLLNSVEHTNALSKHGMQWKTLLLTSNLAQKEPAYIETLYALHLSLYDRQIKKPDVEQLKRAAIAWIASDFEQNTGSTH